MDRWYLSSMAITGHLIAAFMVGFLLLNLCGIGPKEKTTIPLIVGLFVGYPVLLLCCWLVHRNWQQEEDLAVTQPVRALTRRKRLRAFSMVFASLGGLLFVYLGFEGWLVKGLLPAQYLGYAILAIPVLAVAGVNVWYGGPIDPRFDPLPEEFAESYHDPDDHQG